MITFLPLYPKNYQFYDAPSFPLYLDNVVMGFPDPPSLQIFPNIEFKITAQVQDDLQKICRDLRSRKKAKPKLAYVPLNMPLRLSCFLSLQYIKFSSIHKSRGYWLLTCHFYQ